MDKATLRAVKCAAHLKKLLSTFHSGMDGISLNLRFSIATGTLFGANVGYENRWEFLILGDPLRQVREMDEGGGKQLGKILLSQGISFVFRLLTLFSESWEMVKEYCTATQLGSAMLLETIKDIHIPLLPLVLPLKQLLTIEEPLQVIDLLFQCLM